MLWVMGKVTALFIKSVEALRPISTWLKRVKCWRFSNAELSVACLRKILFTLFLLTCNKAHSTHTHFQTDNNFMTTRDTRNETASAFCSSLSLYFSRSERFPPSHSPRPLIHLPMFCKLKKKRKFAASADEMLIFRVQL